ncbi:hypothetical protein [Agromyces salentinus]|uniref:hypothetical protein n=1 Tax=Agromyces salentinus TaxID=269421 RepID=UPI0012FB651D|nr:hypothetical protein [Agromyces salentinus]
MRAASGGAGAARPARLAGVAAAALLCASLGGCAVNAGSAASDRFDAAMAGVEGVVLADARISNDLPFSGSGSLVLWLDPDAERDDLVAAVDRALAFDAGPGVNVRSVIVGFGEGEVSPLDGGFEQGVSVEFPRETSADEVVDQVIAFDGDPDLSWLDATFREIDLAVAEGADACAVIARVQQALGVADVEKIDAWSPDDGSIDPATCSGGR